MNVRKAPNFSEWRRAFHFVILAALVAVTVLASSCELVDPTEVRNPQITDESFVGEPGSTVAALQGLRTEFTTLVENVAYFTDCVSDNYDNIATFISPSADFPTQITNSDLTLTGNQAPYPQAQRLRAEATFLVDEIAPADPNPTAVGPLVGEARFYRGMASLLLAENFSQFPLVPDGAAQAASVALDDAITDFTAVVASTASSNIRAAAQFALARAYHARGLKTEAVTAANAALALNPTFVFTAQFDAATNTNLVWTFCVARALRDMQPLPRLDFLDPKYTDATGISPIAVLKAEEMHLILAEAALSDNNLAEAKTQMKNAIGVALGTASGRTPVNFTDPDTRGTRPNADTVLVQADASSPARAGLVKRRSGSVVAVKQISNTSIAQADVDTLVLGADHLRMLHLLRQEIFFLEGRRMSDLGIRLPIMQREIETNPTIGFGDGGTTPVVPSYIPANDDMDDFTTAAGVTTILYDMNRVLAINRVAKFTMPF